MNKISAFGLKIAGDFLDQADHLVGDFLMDAVESGAGVSFLWPLDRRDAQDYWRIFNRKLESLKTNSPATTETRNNWIVPLLGLLGYQLEYQSRSVELNGKGYPISHRAINRGCPTAAMAWSVRVGVDLIALLIFARKKNL